MTVGTSQADRRFGGFSRRGAVDATATRAWSAALVLLAGGSLALAVAPLLAVVSTAKGPPAAPGFTSWPLLAVLALAPAAVVLGLARRAPAVAAGLVLGLAALAPGRAVLDLQLFADAGLAARPELVVATSLVPLRPGPGLVLLLAGQLFIAVAGLVVLTRVRTGPASQEADRDVPVARTAADGVGDELAGRGAVRQGLLLSAFGLGVVAAVGLLARPFDSATGFLPARPAFDGPGWTLAGAVLLAVLLPVASFLLAASAGRGTARGGLLGLAAAVAAVAAPAVAAGSFSAELAPAPGPVAALAAAGGLALLAAPAGRRITRDPALPRPDLVLPAAERLHRLSGAIALAAGVLAAAAVAAPALRVPPGTAEPALTQGRLLVVAAVVLGVLGATLLMSPAPGRVAALTRPALSVAWVTGPLAATALLDPVLTATTVPGVGLGAGSWCAVVVLVLAPAAGVCAALAGGVERDDVDLSALAERGTDRPLLLCGAAAAVLAVPAFVLPLARAEGHQLMAVTPGASTTGVQLSGWGLLAGLVAVVLATVLAAWCRPARAVAMLAGAGLVVLLRLAELPLVVARIEGAAPAAGTWFALAFLVVLVIGIGLVTRPSVC